MNIIGDKIGEARRAKNMTQEALADALRVSRSTVSSWERGRTEPDIQGLRDLTVLLDFDFTQFSHPGDGEADAIKAEPQELPGEAEAIEAEAPEAPAEADVAETEAQEPPAEAAANPPVPPKRPDLTRRWIIAAAVLLVCAAAVCGLILTRRPPASGFKAEMYAQQTPNDPSRAYLDITDRIWEAQSEGASYTRYATTLTELNGKPFTVTRVVADMENAKRDNVRGFVLTGEDLKNAGYEPDIPAAGTLILDGGFPKGDFLRVGLVITGTDADGTVNTFYHLIQF